MKYDYHFMSPSGQRLAAIAKLLEDRKIVPVVDQVYRLDQRAKTFAHAEAGRTVGKVIITP